MTRLHPLTLLVAAVVPAIATLAVNRWHVSAVVLAAMVLFVALSGLGRRVLPAAGVVLAPLLLSLLLTHGLFFAEGQSVLWTAGPVRVTTEGLGFAADMGLRTAVFVVAFLAFSFSVQPADLLAVLTEMRVPPQFGFVLCSTLTLAPAITARAQRISQAQQARGLVIGRGLAGRVRIVQQQSVPLVLALLHEAGSRAESLEARGFGAPGPRTSYRQVPDSVGQRVFRWAALLILALFLALWFSSVLHATAAAPALTGGAA
jgi:energy-coupling factor transport system permease protein